MVLAKQRVENEGLALRRSGPGIGDIIHAHGAMHVSWRICDEIRIDRYKAPSRPIPPILSYSRSGYPSSAAPILGLSML